MSTPNDSVHKPWLQGIRGIYARRLIESPSRVIKVPAGPGAGKTTCLKRRVMRLVGTREARRKDIFVGTFTRVITRALQDAFARPVTERDDGDNPTVKTLHSHAATLLLENPTAVQGRAFRFLLKHEESAMLYDIASKVTEFPRQTDREQQLALLQASWAKQRTLDDARFAAAVDEWLRIHGGMHVGEVVYLATNAIQRGDLEPVRFKHVFVDEYQDLTECEQTFVDLLTVEGGSIVVLGDDDQSIYAFRYNHPEGLGTFPSDDARRAIVDEVPLPDNHRCARAIVALANEIAAQAGSAKEPMQPALADEGVVDFVRWPSLDEEIAGLAAVVRDRSTDRFLILVTRRFIGYQLKALIGEDAVTSFREEVLDVNFVRERFALATLLANEDDAVALRAWLSLEHDSPTPANERNAKAYASVIESGLQGIDLLTSIADGSVPVAGDGRRNIKQRAVRYLEEKARLPQDLTETLSQLFDPALTDAMPGRRIPQNEQAAARATRLRLEELDKNKARGDLDLLRRAANALVSETKEPTLAKIMDTLRYRIGTLAPLIDEEHEPRVRIMTLHGAKGLQERSVIVSGLANEIIPGPTRGNVIQNAAHVREQRRLLYVAVTRAEHELILSWSTSMRTEDTHANDIVSNVRGGRRAISILNQTALLPHRSTAPSRGVEWKQRAMQDQR